MVWQRTTELESGSSRRFGPWPASLPCCGLLWPSGVGRRRRVLSAKTGGERRLAWIFCRLTCCATSDGAGRIHSLDLIHPIAELCCRCMWAASGKITCRIHLQASRRPHFSALVTMAPLAGTGGPHVLDDRQLFASPQLRLGDPRLGTRSLLFPPSQLPGSS